MSRGISATIQTEVEKAAVRPAFLIEFHFDPIARFWTGIGIINWNSVDWSGSGDVIKFTGVEETALVQATGIQFQLAGADAQLVSLALAEDVQGKPVNLYMAFIDSAGSILADPVGPFEYRMDTFDIDETPGASRITLSAESYLASLERARPRRYTHEDQQIEFPGDLGLEFVAGIQNKEIKWGQS